MSIKDHFSFTRGEKRGVVILLSIIVLLMVGILLMDYLKVNEQTDFSEFEKAIDEFEQELHTKNKIPNIELFDFNPNTINTDDWKRLGFKDWQIKAINNYKLKGGRFKVKSDVRKIYGISDTFYEKLAPFILLPHQLNEPSKKDVYKTTYSYPSNKETIPKKYSPNTIIDINTADTNDLKRLRGIGSAYATRIVKYRNALGGFTQLEQLKEVYGFNDEVFNLIYPHIKIENASPKQIDINSATAKELKNHPYINWNIANSIIKIRNTNGSFNHVEEIKKSHLINEETYVKIAPYLKVS